MGCRSQDTFWQTSKTDWLKMIITDLHIHSKYSRATSKQLDLKNLERYAKIKGVDLLGTGDFTHPLWYKELKQNLTEQDGVLKTKTGFPFLLQTEVSLMYTDQGKGRRVHNIILAPSFEVVDQITEYFKKHGRVDYDGRPIFKIPCDEMAYELTKISNDIEIIPAHAWTPWFGLLGSMSGFDSVEESFKDQTKHIHALETGLSSDPAMNWRLSRLDRFALVSFSDLHSFWPWRIGREATVFSCKPNYKEIIKAIRGKNIKETIEVDPAYGKYHWDGHRKCNVCMSPKETIKLKSICPKCGRKLTLGVEYRVEQLADRPEGFKPKGVAPFKRLIPLSEIISTLTSSGIATKKVWTFYNQLIDAFRSEFNILLNVPQEELEKVTHPKIAKAIIDNREGKIKVKPGYDGEYGVPIFKEKIENSQKTLI